ncbi:MAG: hypothetical protein K2K72_05775, partial [Duncaniella sp.]|nr:hypothetical protein [Duncaniella sp.]
MSFWNGVKSAFGFGTSDDEEEYDSDLPTYAPKPIQLEQHSPQPAATPQEDESGSETAVASETVTEPAATVAAPAPEGETTAPDTAGKAETPKVEDLTLPPDL